MKPSRAYLKLLNLIELSRGSNFKDGHLQVGGQAAECASFRSSVSCHIGSLIPHETDLMSGKYPQQLF